MKRIYVPHAQLGACCLQNKAHHYVAHVLRCRLGEYIEVFDGGGKTFLARIENVSGKETLLTLTPARLNRPPSLAPSVCFLSALLRQPARFEWFLQKATELGAAEFWPLLTERTQPSAGASTQRQARWQKILEEAARQSQRNHLPKLMPCLPLAEALQQQPPYGSLWLFNEAETHCALREAFASQAFQGRTLVLIGPEGGWAPSEVALAKQQGAVSVGLGPNILKSETAALAVLSILQFVAGQLG